MKLFKNANIYTAHGNDWDKKPLSFMLVADDGKILKIGNTNEESKFLTSQINSLHSKKTNNIEIIDLNGKTVLPGFIDSHVHIPGDSIVSLFEINLYDVKTRDSTLDKIKDYIKKHPDEPAYFGDGFSMGIGKNGLLYKEWLDEIESEKPIVLKSSDGHTAWLNSKALSLCGAFNTKDLKNKDCLPLNKNAEPVGLLIEDYSLLTLKHEFTEGQKKLLVKDFHNKMAGWGYTTLMLIAPHFIDRETLLDNCKREDFKLRVNLSEKIFPEDDETNIQEIFRLSEKYRLEFQNDSKIRYNTIKLFADGVIEGGTAFLEEPYENCGNYRSEFLWGDKNKFKLVLKTAVERNFQIHVHTIGDASTRMLLDMMEEIASPETWKKLRPTFSHLQLVREEDIKRMTEFGVVASHQPFWHFIEPGHTIESEEFRIGKERMMKCYPVKSSFDGDQKVTFSGDFPVSYNHPFFGIDVAVTRNLNNGPHYGVPDLDDIDNPKWLRNTDQRITLKQAIEAYTINGAYQLFRENEIGSLKENKRADFIVLDQDPFKIKEIDLDKVEILETYIDGVKIAF